MDETTTPGEKNNLTDEPRSSADAAPTEPNVDVPQPAPNVEATTPEPNVDVPQPASNVETTPPEPTCPAPSSPAPKTTTPAQYALMSAFVYPGAGQFARKQKGKAWVMVIFFTIFFVMWGILVAKGLINCYGGVFDASGSPDDLELGVSYLKRSLIPGGVAALVFVHSIFDAYKG